MKANERVAWRWDEGGEAGQEVGRCHDAVGLLAAGVLDAVGDATIAEDREALEAKWGASAVAEESLAALAVVGGNRDGRVDIEAARGASTA